MENILKEIIDRYKTGSGSIVSILQDTQSQFGYIPEEAISHFASELNIPESKFYGVATFYSQFCLKPRGRNIVTACCGTACHVKGVDSIINAVNRRLGLSENNETTNDGEFTLEKVACLGFCSIAPVLLVNGEVFGKAEPQKIIKKIDLIAGRDNEQ